MINIYQGYGLLRILFRYALLLCFMLVPVFVAAELLPNPGFEINASNWSLYNNTANGAQSVGSRTITQGEYDAGIAGYKICCSTNNGSSQNDIQLYTYECPITKSTYYRLTFRAKATTPFTLPAVKLIKRASPWNQYTEFIINESPAITDSWQTHTVYFFSNIDAADARVNFLLGGGLPPGSTFYFDTASLVPAAPDFDFNIVPFTEDFENTELSNLRWGAGLNFSAGKTGQGIYLENNSTSTIISAFTIIPVEQLKGKIVAVAANIRGENISQKQQTSHGISIRITGGSTYGGNCALDSTGTFTWENIGLPFYISTSAVSVSVKLSMINVSGKAYFDDVTVKVLQNLQDYPPARDQSVAIPASCVLRGTMVSTVVSSDSLKVLDEWNANLIRWQLGGTAYSRALTRPDYDTLLAEEIAKLDYALPYCLDYGILVMVDLHSLSRGLFRSVAAQDKLVEAWKTIATKYKDTMAVWGYDLANEPQLDDGAWGEGIMPWEELAEKIAREIRKIDPVKFIIIESPYSSRAAFAVMRPVDFSIPNIIYSVHMYTPHSFTHQLLYDETETYVYPGIIDGEMWNKQRLVAELQPVKDFQDKYRVPVVVGEFSAVRWAPSNSACTYLQDCIEIFESYGWDWTYHAFREAQCWSVEYNEDKNDMTHPVTTDRQMLLRSRFEQNSPPFLPPAPPDGLRVR